MTEDLNEVITWVRSEREQIATTTVTDIDTYNRFQRIISHLQTIEAVLLKEIASLQAAANNHPTALNYFTPVVDNKYFRS